MSWPRLDTHFISTTVWYVSLAITQRTYRSGQRAPVVPGRYETFALRSARVTLKERTGDARREVLPCASRYSIRSPPNAKTNRQ